MINDLAPFFSPKGVAIIGASTNPKKLSFGILENLKAYGFTGSIYPVNPKADEILGKKCFPDVKDVPDPVDLAVIVLPASMAPDLLRSCGERGIKAVIIISGGFREVGSSGRALEEECSQIAESYGMRIVGPNCVGTIGLHTGLNTTFIKGMPDKGGIGFLSQSGAVCGGVVDYIIDKHIGFSHFASLGNEMDVDESDMIAFFGEDPEVKVIAAYVEGIQDGEKFLKIASRVSKEKPIVLLKAGRTGEGAKAVSSHTGSLAGAYSAYQAAFRKAGVIEVPDLSSLFDVAWALNCQPLPQGDDVAILTNSGGPAALASDSLAANGFTLATISTEKQESLAEKLNPSAQVANPVDMLGGADAEEFAHALSTLKDDRNIDVLFPMLVPQSLVDPADIARAIIDQTRNTDKTVIACMVGEQSIKEARRILHKNRVPMVIFPEIPGQILKAMAQYREWKSGDGGASFAYPDIDRKAVETHLGKVQGLVLGEAETRPIMEAYGLNPVPGGVAKDEIAAAELADKIGYPVAIKVVSPQVLHKSDVGGIALDLDTPEAVSYATLKMKADVLKAVPEAKIEGFLVEKMAPEGLEVIVGMRRDPAFGPVMMFGLGGVFVELFKDVGFGIAPLKPSDAREMIEQTKAGQLLQGYRGGPVYDLEAVVDAIGRLSVLAIDFPWISEVEINPLLVLPKGEGALVLDARMILEEKAK
jgi:acetyltransferase